MTQAQKEAARELMASQRRTAPMGPFVPALRSPEFMKRLQRLGEHLRFGSVLDQRLVELAILLTARAWTQQFEWHVHAPLAAQHGLQPAVIEAIAAGRRPVALAPDEAIVHDFCTELQRAQAVGDASYARALEAFGEAGVVELTGIVGYYTMLAMIMNVARTPLPDGVPPPLAPLPGN